MSSTIRVALQGIMSAKLRTVLVALSLCLSILSIVTIAAASSAVADAVTARALLVGGAPSTFVLSGFSGDAGLIQANLWASYLRPLADGDSVTVMGDLSELRLETLSNRIDASMLFVDRDYRKIHRLPLLSGSWIGAGKVASIAVPVVVNRATMAYGDLHLGSEVQFRLGTESGLLRGDVVGLVEDGSLNPQVYISREVARQFLSSNGSSASYSIALSSDDMTLNTLIARVASIQVIIGNSAKISVVRSDTVSNLSDELGTVTGSFIIVGVMRLILRLRRSVVL